MGAEFPSDVAIRREISSAVERNLCVEAGAGTGKTTVLVDRIVMILRSGHATVRQLAVITFTEKAAAELSGRVRQGLESALASTGTSLEESERLADAILELNHAHIETIHAFAAGLLRERPIEAHLDPGFVVLDALPSQLAFESAYNDWLTEEMAKEPPEGPPDALVSALNLGLKFELVREAAERLNGFRDLRPLMPYIYEDVDVGAALADMAPHVDKLRQMSPRMIDDQDLAYCAIPGFIDMYEGFLALHAQPDALARSLATTSWPGYNGAQPHWVDPNDCRKTKGAMDAIVAVMKECARKLRRNATADLMQWLGGFVDYYEDRRRADGVADFDDLLIWSRNLIRDSAEVRRYFQRIYTCILVDEFQDTDPIQAEMIVRLCEDGAPAENWRQARLRPGSLFVVGDPKQSIYRFRRADITMYDDVKRGVFGEDVREIVQNFRSAEPIIAWVNHAFEQLFDEKAGVQPHYISLQAHPDYVCDRVDALTVVRGAVAPAKPGGNVAIGDVRRAEAGALASIVAAAVNDGSWRVRVKGAVTHRPAAYRDIAVLVPKRTELHFYEEAFASADVPYRHEGGRAFFGRQEVRDLIALLRAIDDPSDEIAAVAALRSAAFGCSDEELFLHRGSGGRFDYTRVTSDATGAVADALRRLRALSAVRSDLALPEFVRTVLDATRLVEFAMLQPQGEQIAANLLKLIDQARAFADAQPGGLRGFVRWLKDNIARDTDTSDASISEDSDNVVRIVTIHASKGLEFPVVVLANMSGDRTIRTNVIVDRRDRMFHVKLGNKDHDFQTPGYDDAETVDREHALAEEIRLLYVAATRARDRLVVPFFVGASEKTPDWSKKERKSLNDWLRSAGADAGDAIEAPVPTGGEMRVWRWRQQSVPPAAVAQAVERRTAWQADRAALIVEAATSLRIVTATSLKDGWEPPFAAEEDRVRRGRAAEFGSAVHALLERIDLLDPGDLDARAIALAAEFGMPERAAEMATVARQALASDVMRRVGDALRGGGRVLREVGFTAPLPGDGGGYAEGRIDLMFEEADEAGRGIVVVDFKTDNVPAAEANIRATTTYGKQAQIYAWAAHRATGMPVREVVFLFARIPKESATLVDAAFMAAADALMRDAAVGVAG